MVDEVKSKQSFITTVYGINQLDTSDLFKDVTLSLPIRKSRREETTAVHSLPQPYISSDEGREPTIDESKQFVIKLPRIDKLSNLIICKTHHEPGYSVMMNNMFLIFLMV